MNSDDCILSFSWSGLHPFSKDVSIDVRYNQMRSDQNRFLSHYHSYFCGFYVIEGEYVLQFENQTVRVQKNHCMLIRPHTIHYVHKGTNAAGYALAVNQDLMMQTFLLHMAQNRVFSDFFYNQFIGQDDKKTFLHLHDNDPKNTIQILQNIEKELHVQDAFTKDMAEMLFALFLAQLARGSGQSTLNTSVSSQPTLKSILNYIQEHSASATLQSTAEYFHYNSSYLSRFLSKETGKTFRDWQKQYRMEKAIFLLENTDNCIENISQLIGYTTTSYFYQAFQNAYNMTPTQYRKAYRTSHSHIKIQG